MKSTLTLAALAAAVCTLTACGGGGGNSPATASDTSPPDTSQPDTSQSGTYEALPVPYGLTASLALLNQEGAKGYRYLSGERFTADGTTTANGVPTGSSKWIFIRDGLAPTYTYETLNIASTVDSLVAQINAEGAKGYRYEGDVDPNDLSPTGQNLYNATSYQLYRKDGDSTATYTYVADPTSSNTSATSFLAQANNLGRSGYIFIATISDPKFNLSKFNLYMKNNASTARYVYETLPFASTPDDLFNHFNSEGSRGYRPKGASMFSNQSYEVYIKDQTQSATFTWQTETPQASSIGFINQANNLMAQGYTYFGDIIPDDNSTSQMSLYFKASNCSGFLCVSLNPLSQN